MILPGLLIPSDKYFLKNLTFVVRISTRVATSPFQSNSLRGQGEEHKKVNKLTELHSLTYTVDGDNRHKANTAQMYSNTNTLSLGEYEYKYEYSKLKCIRIRILSKVFANTFLNTFP